MSRYYYRLCKGSLQVVRPTTFVTRTTSFAKPLDFVEIYDTVKQKSEDKVGNCNVGTHAVSEISPSFL